MGRKDGIVGAPGSIASLPSCGEWVAAQQIQCPRECLSARMGNSE
jgi:hypothetical protein